jgi:hypothetical protein
MVLKSSKKSEDLQAAVLEKKRAQIEKVESDLKKTMGMSDKVKTIDAIDRKRTLGEIIKDQGAVLQAIIEKKGDEDNSVYLEGIEHGENAEDETDDGDQGDLDTAVGDGHTGGQDAQKNGQTKGAQHKDQVTEAKDKNEDDDGYEDDQVNGMLD